MLHQQERILTMLLAARKKANVAGNNTGVRKKPSADEFDGDFLMDYDEK